MIYTQKVSVIPNAISTFARYFKVMDLSVPVDVHFMGENWELSTKVKQGLSIDFSRYGGMCKRIIITSPSNQNIEFWAGEVPAEDSSLSGTIGVGAGKRIVYNAKQTVTNAAAVEIFGQDLQRKLGTFSTDGVVFVDNEATGIRLEAGLHVWENGQPLKLIAETNSVEVRSQDEGY